MSPISPAPAACSAARRAFFPQFATHNAHTAGGGSRIRRQRARDWEFQRLHGMGEALYDRSSARTRLDRPCRVYAPVGSHEDLLAYLVRRLLENGANTSFVNRIIDEPPADRRRSSPIRSPHWPVLPIKPHPGIPLPPDLYRPGAPRIHPGSTSTTRERLEDLRERLSAACRHPAGRRRSSAGSSGPAPRGGLRPERPPPATRHGCR